MVADGDYVPETGDICWLEFDDERVGHEQSGKRPALVLTPSEYNKKTGLMICCPMTSKPKGYPLEVLISKDSAVLVDQIKSMAFKERNAEKKSAVNNDVLLDVRDKLALLLDIE